MQSQRSQVPERWVTMQQSFLVANGLSHGSVQLQGTDHGSPGWAESHQANPVPAEMKPPQILARTEQGDISAGLRIACRLSCALAQRAGNTSQREVWEGRLTTGMNRHHVIDMKSRFLASLSQTAVLAPVLGPLNNQPPQMRRDGHAFTRSDCSGAGTAGAATREVRRDPPTLRPRASRPQSGDGLRLACRAGREAASRRPWATGTGPGRRASAPQVGSLDSYARYLSLEHSTGQETSCPILKTPFHLNAPQSAEGFSAGCRS